MSDEEAEDADYQARREAAMEYVREMRQYMTPQEASAMCHGAFIAGWLKARAHFREFYKGFYCD